MANKPIFYWDSCIFISWLKRESRPEPGVNEGLEEIVKQVHDNNVYLITSALTKAEILESTLPKEGAEKLEGVLKRRNVRVIETNERVWEKAHDIRDYYKREPGGRTLSLPDAVHVATAILYDADVLHTLDLEDKQNRPRALIPLSGNVAGYPLTIVMPKAKQIGIQWGNFTQAEEEEGNEED